MQMLRTSVDVVPKKSLIAQTQADLKKQAL